MTSSKSTLYTVIALLIVASTLLTGSCSHEKKIRGDEYIDRDKLVLVLSDMHLMDAITNDMRYYRKYNPDDSLDLYGPIFEKYNVTREEYLRTLEEYSKYPELLDEVYDEVLMHLNMLQDEVENEEEVREEVKTKLKNEERERGRADKKITR